MYEILMKNGVEVPRHMIVNRGEDSDHTDGEYSSSSNKERRENEKGKEGEGGGREERGGRGEESDHTNGD